MYAACVYLRFVTLSGDVKTALVFSKHRIVSSKCKQSRKNSIPRNELNGLLLATEVGISVLDCLRFVYNITNVTYWTDSSVVYAWVINGKRKLETYVQTRVDKIRLVITDEVVFNLIPSQLNPADIATRGLSPHSLAKSDLWFEGPQFLKLTDQFWPKLKLGDIFIDSNLSCTDEEDEDSARLTSTCYTMLKNS